MRIANDADPAGSYQAFSPTVSWQLADHDGERAVHVQLKDSSGNTSEVFLDAITLDRIAPQVTVTTPTTATGSVAFAFSEVVTAITDANLVLRATGTDTDLPATLACFDAAASPVACDTGLSRTATLTPSAALVPTVPYTVVVNPAGRPPLTDPAGNAASETSQSFSI